MNGIVLSLLKEKKKEKVGFQRFSNIFVIIGKGKVEGLYELSQSELGSGKY